MAGERKEDRAPRCLCTGQRRDGLPGGRHLGGREERALPAPQEHLRCEAVTAEAAAIAKHRARGRCSPRVVLFFLSVLGLPLIGASASAAAMRVVAATSDLASLAQAGPGGLAQGEAIISPAAH